MSSSHGPSGTRRRWPLTLLALVLCAAAAGGVGWAAASVLTPAEDPLDASEFTFVQVQSGEVGASVNLNTVARWTPIPVGASRASGVVTEVSVQAGQEVVQGDILFRVDQRPVAVAQGEVPAYRPIGLDAEGPDVAQLQTMLTALGHYAGSVDGNAGARTIAAIRSWQKASGVEQTGVVEVADIIYVPSLPTRVSLDGEVVARGNLVDGGEQVVRALPASPEFRVPVTESQAAMMPAGTRVEITSPDGDQWVALAGRQVTDAQSGSIDVYLDPSDGASICGGACAQVPVTGDALLSSVIVTIEQVSGLVVPSAALVTDASGQISVITESGKRREVTVMASARGMSVIEGVNDGVRVRVPGTEAGE